MVLVRGVARVVVEVAVAIAMAVLGVAAAAAAALPLFVADSTLLAMTTDMMTTKNSLTASSAAVFETAPP